MNKAEYESLSQAFRNKILAELQKSEEDRVPVDEWMQLEVIATCHTPGCPRDGLSHKLQISEPVDGVYRVLCAPCNRAIEDLDPMLEDAPDFRLNVRDENGELGVRGV
jgi:hypothetical protein